MFKLAKNPAVEALSVTISRTIPKSLHWLNFLANNPSIQSKNWPKNNHFIYLSCSKQKQLQVEFRINKMPKVQ